MATRLRNVESERATNPVSLETTGLNSLADASGVLSSAISNDAATELDPFVNYFFLRKGTATPPTENTLLTLTEVLQDGTTYVTSNTAEAETRPVDGYLGGFVMDNLTSTDEEIPLARKLAGHRDFKVMTVNTGGTALAATLNTLRGDFFGYQSV